MLAIHWGATAWLGRDWPTSSRFFWLIYPCRSARGHSRKNIGRLDNILNQKVGVGRVFSGLGIRRDAHDHRIDPGRLGKKRVPAGAAIVNEPVGEGRHGDIAGGLSFWDRMPTFHSGATNPAM